MLQHTSGDLSSSFWSTGLLLRNASSTEAAFRVGTRRSINWICEQVLLYIEQLVMKGSNNNNHIKIQVLKTIALMSLQKKTLGGVALVTGAGSR